MLSMPSRDKAEPFTVSEVKHFAFTSKFAITDATCTKKQTHNGFYKNHHLYTWESNYYSYLTFLFVALPAPITTVLTLTTEFLVLSFSDHPRSNK